MPPSNLYLSRRSLNQNCVWNHISTLSLPTPPSNLSLSLSWRGLNQNCVRNHIDPLSLLTPPFDLSLSLSLGMDNSLIYFQSNLGHEMDPLHFKGEWRGSGSGCHVVVVVVVVVCVCVKRKIINKNKENLIL